MPLRFEPLDLPRDRDALVDFLTGSDWPFHTHVRLAEADLDAMDFESAGGERWWIIDGEAHIGLVRLLDLDDIGLGAPQFDLRIATTHRGRGVGLAAVRWLVSRVFDTFPAAHRIEANTRADNVGMQRVLERAGFTREGRLRESWPAADRWHDSLVFGVLRSDPLR